MSDMIKVALEVQHAVGHPQPRGIGHYSMSMIQALLKRSRFDYYLTFFDYNKEVGNRQRVESLFSKYEARLCECNDLDYRIASRIDDAWEHKSYNQYTKTDCDLYHFMNIVTIPANITGKVIVTVHDLNWCAYPEGVSDHVRSLVEVGLKRLNHLQPEVIAISQSTKDELLKFSLIPEEKINVVYQSYDEENLYPDSCYPNDVVKGSYILFIGTIESKKNVCAMLDAFFEIVGKYPDLKFVLAGKPAWEDMSHFYRKIEESRFRERIVLPGYVDIATKRKLYSHALCFLFPSVCEGWGNPVLEAMACGCPVITSNTTAMPEAGGDAAVYVESGNVSMLAEKLDGILSSDETRSALVEKGLKHSKFFSWDKTASQVEAVYRKLYAS